MKNKKNKPHKLYLYKSYILELNRLTLLNNFQVDEFHSKLDVLHDAFLQEYEYIYHHPNIQLNSFSEEEYEHKTRGLFVPKLATLTNNFHKKWLFSPQYKYFKMLALQLRQDFKSARYKNQISTILSKYDWDIHNKESKERIRQDLTALKLFPTSQEIANMCRAKIIIDKQTSLSIPIDFSFGVGDNIIKQENKLFANFKLNLLGTWYELNLHTHLPPHAKKFILNYNNVITKVCKPKFVKKFDNDGKTKWLTIITIEYLQNIKDYNSNTDMKIMGVDIGMVKPYSAIVVQNGSIMSEELLCSKETSKVNKKLKIVKENLSNCYRKLNHYTLLLENYDQCFYNEHDNKNGYNRHQFMMKLVEKRKYLKHEIRCLRRKRKELQKRKSYLSARDLICQLQTIGVDLVKLEHLNWVECTGGSWDFSQQQDIIEKKCLEHGILVSYINASNTSKQNPYKKKNEYGRINTDTRTVKFKKYVIDRDKLAAINIACRPVKFYSKILKIKKTEQQYIQRIIMKYQSKRLNNIKYR